ncbi:MAG: M23 family metallopeptidase [Hyphomicrobiales bacterium]|nr:MAG: M23 family metallopeptidase [Hyphomicrobiales bacterium]
MRWSSDRNGSAASAAFYGVSAEISNSTTGERSEFVGQDNGLALPARASQRGELIIPVAGVKPAELVDTFTQAREGGVRIHDAIDILAPLGTPVLAASAGWVEKLFLSEAGGKTIYIRSPDRKRIYYYAHLNEYAPGVAEGMMVRRGQTIGTVGYSGNASPEAPHLHFAIMTSTPHMKWSEKLVTLNPYSILMGAKPK